MVWPVVSFQTPPSSIAVVAVAPSGATPFQDDVRRSPPPPPRRPSLRKVSSRSSRLWCAEMHQGDRRRIGPDQLEAELEDAVFECLAVEAIRRGKRLRDRIAVDGLAAVRAPVIEEVPAQGVPGLRHDRPESTPGPDRAAARRWQTDPPRCSRPKRSASLGADVRLRRLTASGRGLPVTAIASYMLPLDSHWIVLRGLGWVSGCAAKRRARSFPFVRRLARRSSSAMACAVNRRIGRTFAIRWALVYSSPGTHGKARRFQPGRTLAANRR